MKSSRDTEIREDSNGQHRKLADRAARSAREAADEFAEKAQELSARAHELEEDVRRRASRAGRKIRKSRAAAGERFEDSVDEVQSFVRERPLTAAGLAFAVGAIAMMMLLRR